MIDTIRISGFIDNFILDKQIRSFITVVDEIQNKVYDLSIKTIKDNYRAFYYPNSDRMDVEFSLPKIIYGENIYEIPNEFYIVAQLLKICKETFFKKDSKVYVNRIDICKNVYFEDFDTVQRFIEYHRLVPLPKMRLHKFQHQKYESSVNYYCKEYAVKIYNKTMEYEKRNKEYQFDYYCARYEIGYRTQKLLSIFNCHHSDYYSPFFGIEINFLSDNIMKLYSHFNQIVDNWLPDKTIVNTTSESKMIKIIGKIMNKTTDNIAEISALKQCGIISNSTYKRYVNHEKSKLVWTKEPIKVEMPLNLQQHLNNHLNIRNLLWHTDNLKDSEITLNQ